MKKVATDFPVGSRVQLNSNLKQKGLVIGNTLKSGLYVLAVEWDDGTLEKVLTDTVTPCKSLEEEFQEAKTAINGKLAQAAALIREAADDASRSGHELLQYEDDYSSYPSSEFDIDLIRKAMDSAGWNTSSWYC